MENKEYNIVGNQNLIREENKIKSEKDFEMQSRLTEELLQRQEEQFETIKAAAEKIKNGNLETGIKIIENITYNEGGIIFAGVSWPMYLAEVLYKEKMYDRCWKYLNHISLTHTDCLSKIKRLQAKICSKEKKFNDAFYLQIMSLVYKYRGSKFKPTVEIISKDLKSFLSKINFHISEKILYANILNFIEGNDNEIKIRNEISTWLNIE